MDILLVLRLILFLNQKAIERTVRDNMDNEWHYFFPHYFSVLYVLGHNILYVSYPTKIK